MWSAQGSPAEVGLPVPVPAGPIWELWFGLGGILHVLLPGVPGEELPNLKGSPASSIPIRELVGTSPKMA